MSDKLFRQKSPQIMARLVTDLQLQPYQSAGIMGNAGHESLGMTKLHEIGQPEGKGGYGWMMWTGPRRHLFFAWCNSRGLKWDSDEANYGFLIHELLTSESRALRALRMAQNLEQATSIFEQSYERAGVVNLPSRLNWAHIAMEEYNRAKSAQAEVAMDKWEEEHGVTEDDNG